MVERFNRRIRSEVLGITIYSYRDLEQLLRGFNAAYHARRQCVLDGQTPNQVVAERLQARRQLVHAKTHGRAGPDEIAQARLIVEAAKEVSQPDPPILQLQLVQLLQQTMPEQGLSSLII
jgi:hypothetical protein